MNSIVALVPARGGSRRIPRKNLKLLSGRPLISYTIAAAKASGIFSDIIVSTEDYEIGQLAVDLGAFTALRPAEYAADDSPDIDWVDYTIRTWALDRLDESFAILRPTSPFRSADTIRRAWAQWQDYGAEFDSLRAVEPVRQHPYKMWEVYEQPSGKLCMMPWQGDENERPPAHSRPTQTLPKVYVQNASLEIAHVKTVLEQHSISGWRVVPFFTQGWEGFDINTAEDWLFAELLTDRGLVWLEAP